MFKLMIRDRKNWILILVIHKDPFWVLFYLYVADLADHLGEECSCHQYADDTTIYKSVKAKDLQKGVTKISNSLKNLVHWSDGSKLAINNDKTKAMLVTTITLFGHQELQILV